MNKEKKRDGIESESVGSGDGGGLIHFAPVLAIHTALVSLPVLAAA